MNPDDMTLDDIKAWYTQHEVKFNAEDWGPRSEEGESIGPQHQQPQRSPLPPKKEPDGTVKHRGSTSVRSTDSTPGRMWWWEKQAFPWRERTPADEEWVQVLEEFFAPYLAMLPIPKGNLVRQVYGDLLSYREVADNERLRSTGSAHEAVERAVQDLTRLIAEDDPLFRRPRDGRKRDRDEEARAARRVLMVYLERRKHGTAP